MKGTKFRRNDKVILVHVPRKLRHLAKPGDEVMFIEACPGTRNCIVRFGQMSQRWVPQAYIKSIPPTTAKPPRKYVLVLDVAKARYYDSEMMARARIIELAKEAADRKAPQGVYAVCEVAREIVPCVTASVELTERAPERK